MHPLFAPPHAVGMMQLATAQTMFGLWRFAWRPQGRPCLPSSPGIFS